MTLTLRQHNTRPAAFSGSLPCPVGRELPARNRTLPAFIETYPTAEAHTFLGWVYSFQNRYDEAIAECLEAIRVDETLGNPYNDIGSYLLAKGDSYGCVRWFKRALFAPRYDSYAFPHFNLGRVYEMRRKYLDAARHYTLALEQQPGFAEAAAALRRMQALLN